jgi:hypothetical protein
MATATTAQTPTVSKTISPQEAADLIAKAGSKIFTVTFVKRTDNSLRTINCRRGVHKGLKNDGTKKASKKPGLVTVYDMQLKDYRMINLSGIRTIRMGKTEYQVS